MVAAPPETGAPAAAAPCAALMEAPGERRRGAALFIVLVLSALLAGLAGTAMRTAVSGARAASVFADGARADELGRAAGDIVAYHLVTAGEGARRGGALMVRLPGAEIAMSYVSESARVDVNAAPVALIAALLSAGGADASLVEAVSARIGKMRGSAGGAKADHNVSVFGTSTGTEAPAAPSPPEAPVEAPIEVVRLWTLPDAVARRVLPALTAHGSKTVDPVLADRQVLSVLLGGDDARVDDYVTRRMQGFVNTESALALLPVPSRGFAGFDDAPAVRVLVRVTVAHRLERRYDMVVAPPKGANQLPVIVSWRKLS